MIDRTCDVVVIGAGLSGLTATRRLDQTGVDVWVVEPNDRVGGRVLTVDIGSGKTGEVGGRFLAKGPGDILGLASEMGVDAFPVYDSGDSSWLYDGNYVKADDYPVSEPARRQDAGA